ncbi:RS19 [Hepatospora eriocheir]|uniref:RS19 n=1 Tax=Hepatospora eriocheir TaxID=1081669 RepID=A0A1X0Q8K5_9MICR|nr:RS19 [Hepatospora eriocheir]ORD99786.1 RS19 [Hepatospora eriocheir]
MSIDIKKSRAFITFKYKGKSLEELLEMSVMEFAELIPSSARRHLKRGISTEEYELIKKCESYLKEAKKSDEKPKPILTKERTTIILPSMIGVTIGIHRGNGYFPVEIKPEMIGKRLRDFVCTKTHPSHGRNTVGVISSKPVSLLK